ncbi:DUF2218 domain-containing protein [Actinomadura graeca]|uniref:DUF2218 domain-containing protein n=1 Tax=Actinomadura graeca TaxID=2750812 RepID=A0ABX8QVF7_9ACTN|nr:DUF2218 domain-containing protein [Actinomadura graeca]QXJ22623.1 DUF2218 domain-containing protein [Actinomadura graeca]
MYTSVGVTRTTRGERYLKQLCQHLSRRAEVREIGSDSAVARFTQGDCTMSADAGELTITVESEHPGFHDLVCPRLSEDIERFGRREGLSLEWEKFKEGPGGTPDATAPASRSGPQ